VSQPGTAEVLVFIGVTDPANGRDAYVTLRGVGPLAGELRPEAKLVEGRLFRSGARELVVGRAAQRRLGRALAVGSTVSLPDGGWEVVGVFESNGDSHESEALTDADTLLSAYRRNQFSSVTVRLDGESSLEQFRAALDADPTLSVSAAREDDYYAATTGPFSRLLTAVAYGIGGLMAFGALFGALNTLYAAVSSRATEIATLRAIGFGPAPVVVSVLAEALLLALVGASIGALLSWMLLDGSNISTMTGSSPSQLTFRLQVGPQLILVGILSATAIAIVGGLFAAMRAARVSLAAGLRMV
jgi:putative ABC transport system permease protein